MSSFLDDLRGSLRGSADGIRGSFSGIDRDSVRELPRRTLGWFRNLSGIPRLILVGLVLLVLLVVLSPVVMVVAVLLFGVSVIALMVRAAQKGSLKNWGLVAVASVVLVFAFGGISGALYGIEFIGGDESASSGQGGSREKGNNTSSGDGTEPSPIASSDGSPAASPSALPDSDQVTFTGEVFGYGETFNYDGLTVTGTVVDWNGNHIMVIQDPMRGGGFMLGYPGEEVTVTGEYQGTMTTSEGFSYEAVMAEEVE